MLMKMKKTLILSVLAMAMAMTTSAQVVKKDAWGMKIQEKVFVQMDGTMNSPAKEPPTAQELLACPQGTVFGGEWKEDSGVWSGISTADEGRKDMSTSFYQHFSDCYYKFHGVRFLGLFNYFDEESYNWIYCQERGGINEDGDMTKPIKVKVAFYNDNGEGGHPGDLVYSKVFDLIGEKTGVVMGNSRDGYCNVYSFNVDLGEDLKMEHGFMQINAIDENDETIGCFLSLLTASSSPGFALVRGDNRDGSAPFWMSQLSCCYCLDGDGSFSSDHALKFTRILSPATSDASKFGKVQVELMNIGGETVDNAELQLWQDGKLLGTEKVNANIESLGSYKYTFSSRIDCSEPGIHDIVIKNVTPNSDMIAADTITTEVVKGDGVTYLPSGAEEAYAWYISRVTIGDIDNESEMTCYSDFTDMKTDIRPGEELTLEVEGNSDGLFLGAWVDWNGNCLFEESEVVKFNDDKIAKVKIPDGIDVKPGDKRLRIVFAYGGDKPEGYYYYGETEDYTLVVKNNEGTPALGLDTDMVYEQTEGDKKTATLELENKGAGTLSADVDYCYILPNAPTVNYSMNKVSVPEDVKLNVVRKTTAKAAKDPSKADDTQYVLRYDNSQYDIVGVGNYDDAVFANYFPGQMLSSLKGMTISSVDVYVANPPKESSIVIYGEKDQNHNGDVVAEQVFEAQPNSWNHVVLDKPVTIGETDLWIGYKLNGMDHSGFSIGVDNGKGVLGYGDRIYIGGNVWWSMGDLGIDYNYCIRANVIGERTPAIDWLTLDTKHLDMEEAKAGKLNLNIDASKLDYALYEAKIEIKTNDELRSVISIPVYVVNGKATGIIAKEFTGGATVKVSGGNIEISSDKDIKNVQVFDLSGKLVKAMNVGGKNLNTIVDGLNDKLYILKMNYADGSCSSVKVPVIK